MAITWTVNITNVDVAQKRADVSFIRIDDVTSESETYNFKKVILETTPQRIALLDLVWQKHLDAEISQGNIDTFVSGLEASAKANLEGRE